MRTLHPLLLLFFTLLFAGSSTAQDKLNMLSGAVIDGKVIEVTDSLVRITEKRKNKTKDNNIEVYRVFSIDYADGSEEILYVQDTTIGNYFSQEEMRYYVLGEQDALNYYKGNLAFYLGVLYGAGGGVLLAESYFVLAVPLSYALGASVPRINIKPGKVRDSKLLEHSAYIMGYERAAKARRWQKGLLGSAIGTAIGAGAFFLNREINE